MWFGSFFMFLFTGGDHSLLAIFPLPSLEHTIALCSIIPLIPFSNSDDHQKYLDQAMVGLLLGDGTLRKKYEGGSTYFKFAQGQVNSDYLHHVFDIFKHAGYVLMDAPSPGKSVVKGKVYQWYQFSTQSIPAWNALHALWYVNGVKVVPANIFDLLTPVSLAYWHMDDGGWNKGGINLNTNSFTKAEVTLLAEVLRTKFGLKCSVQSRNRLYIWSSSTAQFCDLIRPYVHPSMVYKITPLV